MRKQRRTLSVVALVAAVASYHNVGSAYEFLNERLVVGDVATTVRVVSFGRNDFAIQVHFVSSKYPVGCLSAYRDLHYELRDSNNRVIPINQQTLAHQQWEGQGYQHVIARATAHPCAENAPMDVWDARAVFSMLYPNLSPGKYTLHISFTPHDSAQHADFTPVPITIEPSPSAT